MADAEALLFVDDDEPERFEGHVRLQEAVGADDDVDPAGGQAGQDGALLGVGSEAREHLDPDGEGGHALGEGGGVLLRQNGRGHEHRHLVAAADGLEGGADGDLRLAVAHVPHDETVHGAVALHVRFHVARGGGLVGRFDEGEGGFEFHLPGSVVVAGDAGQHLPGGVELEQIFGQLAHGLADLLLGALPLLGAQPGEAGRGVTGADVALQAVELVRGDQEAVVLGEA